MGGAGNDSYRYARGDGVDQIEDLDSTPGNADSLVFGATIASTDVSVFASGQDYIFSVGDGAVRLRGGRSAEGTIERVEFTDGTSWTAGDIELRAQLLPDNRGPQMADTFGSVAVVPGGRLSFTVPRDSIVDSDRFDSLQYYAITADGERLPEWLEFDSTTLAITGTQTQQEVGRHELLLIAVDQAGEAARTTLSVVVGAGEAPVIVPPEPPAPIPVVVSPPPVESAPPVEPATIDTPDVPAVPVPVPAPVVVSPVRAESVPPSSEESVAIDVPVAPAVPTPVVAANAIAGTPPLFAPTADSTRVGVPIDPLFRDMQQRFDVLLQAGRANLGDRYAEAIREFEERRIEREETPPPPPPSDEEVGAWNSAMHAWHDRNPGFAETDLGGNDGAWNVGWGLPGPGESAYAGSGVGTSMPGLANPLSQARLTGAASAPALGEGLREIR